MQNANYFFENRHKHVKNIENEGSILPTFTLFLHGSLESLNHLTDHQNPFFYSSVAQNK